MNNANQEILSQVIFWSGIGCLPISIAAFVAAFCALKRWRAFVMLGIGSITTTHFLWYFKALGESLATKVGESHPTPWLYIYPIGFAISALLAVIIIYMGKKRLNKNMENKP